VTDEDLRLQHNAAEQAARQAAVPAPSPQPPVPGHETEVLTSHEGRPTQAEQQKREWRVFP
jgi:hypothetical protein